MTISNTAFSKLSLLSAAVRKLMPVAAVALLIAAMDGTWTRSASAAPLATSQPTTRSADTAPRSDDPDDRPAKKSNRKEVTGKVNLNTANEEQLMLLPTVGQSKAELIIAWRSKHGGFKRVADLRRVKGFGYKTFKKLEPYLDIKGDTTLAPK